MKAAFHTRKKEIEVREVPMPDIGPEEYLIRNRACAICGSDVWWNVEAVENEPIHGHETAGEIVKAGKDARRFSEGDRVVCYAIKGCGDCGYCRGGNPTNCQTKGFVEGGFQEYSVFPESLLFPCPKEYEFVTASLLSDAIGVPLRGLRRLPPETSDTVAVWGLGPLGLLQIMFLKALGVRRVIGLDAIGSRLRKGMELGAEAVFNPSDVDAVEEIKRITDGLGCDKAYIYVRHPKVTEDVFKSTKEGASICTFVGLDGKYELQEWFERTLLWSFYFTPNEYGENLEFIRKRDIDLRKVVSDVFSLDNIQEAFLKRFERQDESLKIVIKM